MTTTTNTPTVGHPVNPAGLAGCTYCGHSISGRDSVVTQLGDALVDVCRNRVMCDSRAYLTPMTKAVKYVRVLLTIAKGDAAHVHQVLLGARVKSAQKAAELAAARGLDADVATSGVTDEYRRMHLALALTTGDNEYRVMS